jgi:phage shock protein C
MQNVEQRFYRSSNRIFGGVCAGLAEGLHIDPLWVRVAFVILVFLQGVGLFVYIILWLVMPERLEAGGQRSGFDAMSADLRRIWGQVQQQTRGTSQPAGTSTAPPPVAPTASGDPTQPVAAPPVASQAHGGPWHNQGVVLGVVLVVGGLAILGSNIGIIQWSVVWPAALITLGIVVLVRNLERRP